jgi:hypothetical protein
MSLKRSQCENGLLFRVQHPDRHPSRLQMIWRQTSGKKQPSFDRGPHLFARRGGGGTSLTDLHHRPSPINSLAPEASPRRCTDKRRQGRTPPPTAQLRHRDGSRYGHPDSSNDAAYRQRPPAPILPSEAFRYNRPDVASHHWPLDQVREPTVRTCGSSRTSQDYYRNNSYINLVSRVKLTCLTTV